MRLAVGLMCIVTGAAGASAQQPNPRVGETTCVEADGTKRAPQPIESQIILPSVGGENQSAARTVQREGQPAEPARDCPTDPATAAKGGKSDPVQSAVGVQSK